MMNLIIGMIAGAVIIMLLPPKYEDWLRQWIITQWQKLTKRG
jgi:hypothetical protein